MRIASAGKKQNRPQARDVRGRLPILASQHRISTRMPCALRTWREETS